MRPALPLEDGVRAVALDGEDDLLEAAAFTPARRELLGREATALGVAREHAEHVARPQRRLVSADTLANLHEDVLPVGWIRLHERELDVTLEAFGLESQIRRQLAQLGVGLSSLEVVANLLPGLCEAVGALELLQTTTNIGCLPVIVVDRRVRHALLRLGVGALEVLDELVDCGHESRVTPGPRARTSGGRAERGLGHNLDAA